jgi:hypothetical protein
MNAMYLPAAPEILETFEQEVRELGGTVRDVYAEGDLLYARAVFPEEVEVRPGDRVHGGVAVRTHDTEILVHPYTYRVVCTNGAIVASASGSRVIERVDVAAPTPTINAVLDELRAAVHAGTALRTLHAAVRAMRSAADREADLLLQLMPFLPHMPPGVGASVLRTIARRFESAGDRTLFGLVNAVTSVARDTSDPDVRWRLEEVGGVMLAHIAEACGTMPSPLESADLGGAEVAAVANGRA